MYRLIVGETGNEQGHTIPTSAKTLRGAKRCLTIALAEYCGDGWGCVQESVETDHGTEWVDQQ